MRREVRKDSQRNDPSTRRAGIFSVLQVEPQISQMIADYGGADEHNGAHGTPRHGRTCLIGGLFV